MNLNARASAQSARKKGRAGLMMRSVCRILATLVVAITMGVATAQAYYDGHGNEVMTLTFQQEGQRVLNPNPVWIKANFLDSGTAFYQMDCLNGSVCMLTVSVPRTFGNAGPMGVAIYVGPNHDKWQGEGRLEINLGGINIFHPTYRVKINQPQMAGWRVWMMNASTGALSDVAPSSTVEPIPYQTMVLTELNVTINPSCTTTPALYVGAAFANEQKRPATLQVKPGEVLEYHYTTQWGVDAGKTRSLNLQLFQQPSSGVYTLYPQNCVRCVYNSKTPGCLGFDTTYGGYHYVVNNVGGNSPN